MKKYLSLEYLAGVSACCVLLAWCLSKVIPVVAAWWLQNWLLLAIVGAIVGLCALAYRAGPALWRAYVVVTDRADTMRIREQHYQMLASATAKLEQGFDTEYHNQPLGFQIKVHNPYVIKGGSVKVQEVPVEQKLLKAPAILPPKSIPEQYDLLEIFKQHRVEPDHVFMGKADGDELLWVDSAKGLCHGVFNAITGRGKTIIERGLEAQLLYCEHEVIHMDLKFSLIDENGLDYRPIAKRLMAMPEIEIEPGYRLPHLMTKIEDIYAGIKWVATTEVARRLAMYRVGDHSYSTFYIFLEELLYLISKFPDLAGYIEDIIVVGRSLGIKLFTAAQNFQAQNTKISGGMRENFESAYYLGGDDYSGAKLLDVKQKDLTDFLLGHNINLGKGLALLRNNTVAPSARITRAGMASNEAIYHLLGRADDFTLDMRPFWLDESNFQKHFSTRNDEPHDDHVSALDDTDYLDSYAQEDAQNCLSGTAQGTQENVKYQLDQMQIELFCVAYGLTGNIDESLKRAGAHTGYRAHARQILAERSLKRGN